MTTPRDTRTPAGKAPEVEKLIDSDLDKVTGGFGPAQHELGVTTGKTELTDADLDQVCGAGPIPYPDVGGSTSSSKVKMGTGTIPISSDTDSGGTSKGGVVGSKITDSTSYTTSSSNVMAEGSPTVVTTQNSD